MDVLNMVSYAAGEEENRASSGAFQPCIIAKFSALLDVRTCIP